MNIKTLENPIWIQCLSLALIPVLLTVSLISGDFGWRLSLPVMGTSIVLIILFHQYPHSFFVKVLLASVLSVLALILVLLSLFLDSDSSLLILKIILLIHIAVLMTASLIKMIRYFMHAATLIKGVSVNGYLQEKVVNMHSSLFYVAALLTAWAELDIITGILLASIYIFLYTSLLCRMIKKRPFLFLGPYLSKLEKQFGEDFSSTIAPEVSLNEIYDHLVNIFETEQWYLSPSISEAEVAQRLLTNRTYLSKAISASGKDVNFRQMLNRYRVQYSIELIKKNPSLNVQDVAAMSGFNVVPTYTASFRFIYGVTPAIWIKNYRKSILEEDMQKQK